MVGPSRTRYIPYSTEPSMFKKNFVQIITYVVKIYRLEAAFFVAGAILLTEMMT